LAAGWVVVIGLAGWYSNVGPSNPGPERTEAKLRQLAASTDTPIYYLGSSFHGEDLEYAAVLSGNGRSSATTRSIQVRACCSSMGRSAVSARVPRR